MAYRLQNNDVSVTCVDPVWDTRKDQLVAVTIAATEKQSLNSILASLSTNSKRYISLRLGYSESVTLSNAQKGYTKLWRTLDCVNANGYVVSMEHPAAGDPRVADFEWFYVTGIVGEDIQKKFVDRLGCAIPWSVLPAWGEYLLEKGLETRLVWKLRIRSDKYVAGYGVMKNSSAWESVISAGLTGGRLKIEQEA